MLKFMRESSQSVLIYVLFGMLVFVFAVSFGPGSGSCGGMGRDYAATVDGEIIRREEFALTFRNQLEYMRRAGGFGGNMNDERLQEELRRQVIDSLIEGRLLALEARRLGLTVSDDELLDTLQTRYGVKDVKYDDYEAFVNRNFGMSVARFEERTREEIIAQRMRRLVTDVVEVGEGELKDKFMREHDRAKVTVVRFDPQDVEPQEVTAAAIDAILEKEPEAVKEQYDRDLFKYRTAQQVAARQILKRLPRDASDADVEKAKSELMGLREQILAGADFAALAKTASDDEATKEQGGDLGFIQRGLMAKSITDAVFALKEGDLTEEPVRSPQGLHLLQVTEIKPPSKKEFDEVKREVAESMLSARARQAKALAQAEAMLNQLKEGADLTSLTWTREEEREAEDKARAANTAVAHKPVRTETGWILKSSDTIPGVGQSKELQEAIFSASLDKPWLDRAFEVGRFVYLAQLTERETPDIDKFDEEKESLRDNAIWSKRNEVFQAWVKNLRNKATIQLNPEIFGSTRNEEASAS